MGVGHNYEFGPIFNYDSVVEVVNTQESSKSAPDVGRVVGDFNPRQEYIGESDYQATE